MVSVLIVNWNTRDLLRACLLSLRACPALRREEIIVVDNASGDGSAAMVRAEFPEVMLLLSTDNSGYAAGNNLGYVLARGDYIWLLNPDTEVQPDALTRMQNFLDEHPRCGAVASMLVDAQTGEPQQSCRTFPSPAALWCEALGLARLFPRSRRFGFYRMGWWDYRDTRRVDQPMASSLLVRRHAIEDAGGLFDEQFPIYFNDVDLCWRLHQANWEIWYLPTARVRHHGGAGTSQVKPAMIASSHESLRRFYKKHYRGRLSPLVYRATLAMMNAAGAWRYRRALRRQARSSGA